MSIELTKVLASYGAAWVEPDRARRLDLLDACWAETGRYVDPTSSARGRAELADLIGGFHTKMPGARIELTSGASEHNSRIYFKWRMITAEGGVAIEGVDFGTLSGDGRIAEIVGFFGPPPAV